MMNIGKILYALRNERELTLEQVALDAEISPSHLSRIENDTKGVSEATLKRIAQVLGTSIGAVYTLAEKLPTSANDSLELLGMDEADFTQDAIQLRRAYRTLTPENKKAALEIVKLLGRLQEKELE